MPASRLWGRTRDISNASATTVQPLVDPRTWAAPPPSGIRRFLPILRWLAAYDRRSVRFDVIAGATARGLLVLRLESPLFYANPTPVRDRIKRLVGASQPPPHALIVDAGANDRLDITAAEMLSELVQTMHTAGIDVALVDVRQPVIRMARRSGLLEQLGQARASHTIDEAVHALSSASRSAVPGVAGAEVR
ncbi:MAG: sodium-independent anion transporter [Solirubrobacterales bacterium]|nr:sodium-independent anion transporter [Solirubrobacterales bacterium]